MSIPFSLGVTMLAIGTVSLGVLFALLFRLHRSEQRFRLLAESASDMVSLHKEDGTYTWVSPSSKALLGRTPEELLGVHPKDLVHPDDLQACREAMRGALKLPHQKASHRAVCRMQRKDGSFVWVETHTESTPSSCGKGLQIRSAARDVSRRMQAENLYRLLIANLPNTSVFLFDRRMAPLVAEGTVATMFRGAGNRIELPADVVRVLAQHHQAALRGEVNVIEESFRMRRYRIHFMPVNGRMEDGRHDMGMIVFQDITEESAVVAALEDQTADLERSNRDLEQFANVASHELKAPLRRISSFAELLATEYQGALSGEADRYLDHIIDGVNTLHGVIESLLTYSRVQTDKSRMDWVDMRQVYADALANLGPLINERGAKVTSGGSLPDMVTGDAGLLRQLLENLIGNAIKFNTTGVSPRVHVTAKRDLVDWQFAIQDNGPGIDEAFRNKVFLMFSRLRPDVEGNGIGLALCKKIVGIHRGRIWYESAVGHGTTFYFALSARSPEDVTDKIPMGRGE